MLISSVKIKYPPFPVNSKFLLIMPEKMAEVNVENLTLLGHHNVVRMPEINFL